MNPRNITLKQLLPMIDRYFDCEMSDAEEAEFRKIIAAVDYSHPSIDEAKALLGFRKSPAAVVVRNHSGINAPSAVGRRQSPLPRRMWMPVAGIAASVAVVAAIGFSFFGSRGLASADSTCIAYINGERVTDEDAVMRQLSADMKEFGDCASDAGRSFMDELDEAFPVIEDFESEML